MTASLLLTASFRSSPLSNLKLAKFATELPGRMQNAPPRWSMFSKRMNAFVVLLTADDAQSFQVPVRQEPCGNARQSLLLPWISPGPAPLKFAFIQKQNVWLGQSEAVDGAACAWIPDNANSTQPITARTTPRPSNRHRRPPDRWVDNLVMTLRSPEDEYGFAYRTRTR